MSDGDKDATRKYPRASGTGAGQLTASSPSSAPWERFSEPPHDDDLYRWQAESPTAARPEKPPEPAAEPVRSSSHATDRAGSHTAGGLTVADLIAKVGAAPVGAPTHHHVASDTESPEIPVDLQDTQVIENPAYSLEVLSELPDLDVTNYPNGDEPESDQDAEEPTASRPAKSKRIRKAKTARKGHRPILLATRSLAALFAVLALVLTG